MFDMSGRTDSRKARVIYNKFDELFGASNQCAIKSNSIQSRFGLRRVLPIGFDLREAQAIQR